MRYYTNLYRDSAGRGFFDRTFHSSESARQQKAEETGQVEYVATVAIVVVSDTPHVPYDLMESALLNKAIPADMLQVQHLDEEPFRESQGRGADTMTYRQNYVIYAVPYQLPETHEWIAKVNIGCDRGADRRIDQYTDEESRFATRDEAIARCFEFGRRVIDEELAEDGNG